MLDDAKYIAQHDSSNGLAMIAGQADQLRTTYEFEVPVVDDLQAIILCGMGGSALAAEFIRSWLVDRLPVPVEIMRGYDLPAYAGEHTPIIASSYSGNTEETLACLDQARAKNLPLMTMDSGGQLQELAQKYGYAHALVPGGLQPRLAILFEVKALAQIIEQLGLLEGIVDELETNAEWLLSEINYFLPNIVTAENPAKKIAEQLLGHPVVIYGGPTLAFAAMKWKIDLNENAKSAAFWNQLPEFNHNEFLGWQHAGKDLRVVELQSDLDNAQVKKRFEISNRLLSGKMPAPTIVEAQGQTKLQQLLWAILLGDFVSAYLAILQGIDPIPVELIEKLKKELT
jgi:glucose/mannose-6-phosphate isomerase